MSNDIDRVKYHFRTTLKHLIQACENYHNDDTQALTIAHNLRKLLADGGNKSVLTQYLQTQGKRKRDILFWDTTSENNPNNMFNCFPLLGIYFPPGGKVEKRGGNSLIFTYKSQNFESFLPKCIIARYQGKSCSEGRLVSFNDWWNEQLILRSSDGKYNFTRKKLIVDCIANKDGGSHVDFRSELPENYDNLILGKFGGDKALKFNCKENPRIIIHHTVRQIGEEVLETLSRCKPVILIRQEISNN